MDRKLVNTLSTQDKMTEFANSVDLHEVVHNEPPHVDLHCLPFQTLNSQYDIVWSKLLKKM